MGSVGHFVIAQGTKILPRPLMKLESVDESLLDFGLGSRIFPSIGDFYSQNKLQIVQLVEESSFVVPSLLASAHNAFRIFDSADILENRSKIHRFVAELLPVYEHGIRRVFICSNSLSSHLFCAVSRGYFTTMDMFLEKTIDVGESTTQGGPNALITDLGNPFSQLLFDLFTHPAGKRPRDRLSHGEADVSSISLQFVDRFFGSFIALCLHFHPRRQEANFWSALPPAFEHCYTFCFERYVSSFHPRSMLQKSLGKLPATLLRMQQVVDLFPPRPSNPEEEDENQSYRRNEYPDSLATFQQHIEALVSLGYSDGLALDAPYRRDSPFTDSAELITVNALSTIAKSFFSAAEAFVSKKEEFDRILSSDKVPVRQRAAFSKFLGAIETLQLGLKCVGLTLALIESKGRKRAMIYQLKILNRLISTFERYVRSFSENNWGGAVEQIVEIVKFLVPLSKG
jgi:hypothetical protein